MTVSLGSTLAEDLGIDVLSLLVFAKVLDCGGISQAAAELQLSRSSVSRRLAELEIQIGTRLLTRSTRRLAATEAGEALLQHCHHIAQEARTAADTVSLLAGGSAKGVLRVSLPPTLGKLCILPRLGEFVGRHPDVSIQLLLTDLPFADISRKVDVAVRIVHGAPEGFVSRPLGKIKWVLVAAPSYLALHAAPRLPEEVASHQCLLFDALTARWRFGAGPRPREIRIAGRIRSNNLEALGILAEQGLGLALLPTYAAAGPLQSGRLVNLLPHVSFYPAGGERIHAVYAPPTATAPRLRAFLAFLDDCLTTKGSRRSN